MKTIKLDYSEEMNSYLSGISVSDVRLMEVYATDF